MANKAKENKKEIPAKNYIFLGIIIIITIIGVLYICSWYKQYNDTKTNTPIITSALREVKYDNLNTVLTERDFLLGDQGSSVVPLEVCNLQVLNPYKNWS